MRPKVDEKRVGYSVHEKNRPNIRHRNVENIDVDQRSPLDDGMDN